MKLIQIVLCLAGMTTAFASEIEVYQAKTISLNSQPKNESAAGITDPKYFIRDWNCGVAGAVTVSDDIVNRQTKIVTSAGTAKVKPLKIMKNGTYYWEAYGEKKTGKWEKSKKSGYPIVLKKAIEGKDWFVGEGRKKDQIIVWDGNAYHYDCSLKN